MEKFTVYKGLQAPLVFKGFKGRYIFWGVGTILGALVIGLISLALFNTVVGLVLIALILGVGLTVTFKYQSRGLYSKRNDNNSVFFMRKKELFKNNEEKN